MIKSMDPRIQDAIYERMLPFAIELGDALKDIRITKQSTIEQRIKTIFGPDTDCPDLYQKLVVVFMECMAGQKLKYMAENDTPQ